MNEPLLVQGLEKAYPSFALGPLSFSIGEGEIVGFVGRNGAGKTTTLRSLLGLARKDSGSVSFFGVEQTPGVALPSTVGFASGDAVCYPRTPIGAQAAVLARFFPDWNEGKWKGYCQSFGLDEKKSPSQLSTGMKIKFQLALALSRGARLLLLDEPTSGLDPFSREEVVALFAKEAQNGVAILYSTHILTDLDRAAERVLLLSHGRLCLDESVHSLREAYCVAPLPPATSPEAEKAILSSLTRGGEAEALIPAKAQSLFPGARKADLEEILLFSEAKYEKSSL